MPYVGQMVFAYVLVEGWTIHPYVYCFFDSCDQVLVHLPHNTEVVNGGTMIVRSTTARWSSSSMIVRTMIYLYKKV